VINAIRVLSLAQFFLKLLALERLFEGFCFNGMRQRTNGDSQLNGLLALMQ